MNRHEVLGVWYFVGPRAALENATVFSYLKPFAPSAHDVLAMIQIGSRKGA